MDKDILRQHRKETVLKLRRYREELKYLEKIIPELEIQVLDLNKLVRLNK